MDKLILANENHILPLVEFIDFMFSEILDDENPLRDFQADRELLTERVGEVVKHGYAFIAPETTVQGKTIIAGSLGATISEPFWWSSETAVCDIWFAVHPDHRQSTIARDLMARMEEVAELEGLSYLSGHTTGGHVSRKDALWTWKGYQKIGSSFIKN